MTVIRNNKSQDIVSICGESWKISHALTSYLDDEES
jgi:hypothetical protein